MTARDQKTAYDDAALAAAKKLVEDNDVPAAEDDYSLEEILAEYGSSRRQRLLADVEQRAAADETADGAAPAPQPSAPKETAEGESPTPENGPDAPQEEPCAPKDEKAAEAESAAAEEGTPPPQELPKPPRPVSVEELVGQTVGDTLEERETLLPEKKRRRGLFSRKPMPDTEQLYAPPEEPEKKPPEPEEPEVIGPEEPLDESAAACRSELKRREKPMPAALLAGLLLSALTVLDARGLTPSFLTGDAQAGILLAGLVLMCLLCRSVFARGFGGLRRRCFTGELLSALSALAAAADCATSFVLTGRSESLPFAAAACVSLLVAQWGGARESRGLFDAYRTAAMSSPPYLVTDTPEGACKQAGRTEGFDTFIRRPNLSAVWQTVLLPVILMGTVVFAALASAGQGRREDFFLCWSAILAAAASPALCLSWGLSWSNLAGRLQKDGCAVAGWNGAEAVSRKKTIILTDADLFPPGTVRLNGVKLYGEEMAHAVSYAASLVQASGSGLGRIFSDLLRSEGGKLCELDDFSFYEEGGYSAVIHGENVILGTISFMRKMEVRLPGNLNLHTGVFLAVDRQLTAVFAVKYSAAENVDWALRLLRRNHITPVLAARDANVTPELLRRKFNRKVKVEYPPLAARLAMSEQESGRGWPRALLLREGLLPYAETVVGSRRLVRAVRRSTAFAVCGSASGALLTFYLSFLGNFTLLTPAALLAFLLLWTLPVLLFAGWTGHF